MTCDAPVVSGSIPGNEPLEASTFGIKPDLSGGLATVGARLSPRPWPWSKIESHELVAFLPLISGHDAPTKEVAFPPEFVTDLELVEGIILWLAIVFDFVGVTDRPVSDVGLDPEVPVAFVHLFSKQVLAGFQDPMIGIDKDEGDWPPFPDQWPPARLPFPWGREERFFFNGKKFGLEGYRGDQGHLL